MCGGRREEGRGRERGGEREGERRREGKERGGEKGVGHRPGIASISSWEGVSFVILPPSTSAGNVGSTHVVGTG